MTAAVEKRLELARRFYEKRLTKEQLEVVMALPRREQRHRQFLLFKQRVCQWCGTNKNLTIDHIKPVSLTKQRREMNLRNKQLLCKRCNGRKANHYPF